MSERGLVLALQRLHDDPGFIDQVAQDPQSTLGIYDLDEAECQALTQAVNNRDEKTLRRMASQVGIDWTSDHIGGVGALGDQEVSTEGAPHLGVAASTAHAGDIAPGTPPIRTSGN